jgi:hypothetical protein
MGAEGSDLAVALNRMLRLVSNELDGLDDEVLNRSLPFEPANTIYQLAFHVAGSARWWSITNTGGIDFRRDRPAEFVSVGTGADLLDNYASLHQQVDDHLTKLTADDLERDIDFPEASISHWEGRTPLSRRDAVLHSIEHTGIHLGHIQLTRQLFGISPRTDWE